MRELHGDLGFIDEHRDELLVLRDAGQDAFDGDESLKTFDTICLGLEDLGHTADVDALEQ